MRGMLLVLIATSAISGCATGKRISDTESGRPEVTINNASQEAVQSELFSLCNSNGAVIRSSSANEVVCAKEMEGGSSVLAQVLIGNSYSTTPVAVARFTIWKSGTGVRVSGYQWAETQMAFGQTRTMELNGPEAFNALQTRLNEIEQRLSSSSPERPKAQPQTAGQPMSESAYRQRQLDALMQQDLPYEQYQRRYREIMGE